jgi:hypothetical protein
MRGRITYANVAATLALLFSMSGGALAASHYLINSTKQINPKVLRKLQGHNGRSGANGVTGQGGLAGPPGAAGKEGPQGKEGAQGKEGPKGPGAAQLTLKLPASASPSFTNVGTIEGISLEAKCAEDVANKVVLEMMYTAPFSFTLMQTRVESINGLETVTTNEDFTEPAAPSPSFWISLEAEKQKTSSERFEGNVVGPELLSAESYFVTGGPSGSCEAAIGMTPTG